MRNLTKKKLDTLDAIYKNTVHPASLGGVKKLYDAARRRNKNIKFQDVKVYLKSIPSYTLHKVTRKTFPRRKMLAPKPKVIISCDLIDIRNLSKYNDDINYLLVCVDICSRFMKIIPLK